MQPSASSNAMQALKAKLLQSPNHSASPCSRASSVSDFGEFQSLKDAETRALYTAFLLLGCGSVLPTFIFGASIGVAVAWTFNQVTLVLGLGRPPVPPAVPIV